jgi:hypothetical protein
MAVAAGIVGDRQLGAVIAARDMAAHDRGSAGLDGRHDLELAQAQAARVDAAERFAVPTQDIGHLK